MVNMNARESNNENRILAEQILLEIAKQSPGDEIVGKARLFKAFYLAHLFYAWKYPGYLSEWPIVKMPMGPGIDDFDSLVSGLVHRGLLAVETTRVGPYLAETYRAIGGDLHCTQLHEHAIAAIKDAVKFIDRKTGAQLSDLTHEFSISWIEAENGEELNIYLDLLGSADHARLRQSTAKVAQELDEAWG